MRFFKEREKHPLVIKNPALLIIDVQSYFFDKKSLAYLRGIENIFGNIEKLIKQFEEKGYPVISTLHVGGTDKMKKWWGNIVKDVEPYFKASYVIKKNTYDAFYNTELEEILEKKSVKDLVITGVMTHLCCETTARSGFVRGYNIVMVEDALWDKDEFYHFLSLKSLAHGFAVISSTEEVLCELE
ncbi:cysteine hydrolase [Thermosipho melanesiensis]|uniref:Isochorismatase hydrolase n=2 Tax=Thermosipho melanesiensis TaxID=46541 RepID=A6LJ10_THEM4|nr:isochorismatase family protein [Thermosipho melanesiensis]ABR29911.1 isochorismatase hydrolase [Thermosipho melanesiensis BI429]APT73119.1 cysteine hydrolase [Thermosipho melanesiensis]OOC38518.1 cysteine hydrolase [Thermosipho melanesiensis]OOC40322.1 cysteine hydrolase [Thermosipho melanesiensis]OOC40586.1 cysteine hydrolase [Thermosipho melanesiensis]